MSGLRQRLGEGGLDSLRQKYGDRFDPLWKASQKMLSNVSADDLNRVEAEFGARGAVEAIFALVQHVGGPGFDAETLDPALALDAISAGAELSEQKGDAEFMDRWASGDLRAADRFRHLNERAFPEREGD